MHFHSIRKLLISLLTLASMLVSSFSLSANSATSFQIDASNSVMSSQPVNHAKPADMTHLHHHQGATLESTDRTDHHTSCENHTSVGTLCCDSTCVSVLALLIPHNLSLPEEASPQEHPLPSTGDVYHKTQPPFRPPIV